MERMLDDATPAESSDESDDHEAMIRRLRPIKLLTHTTKQLLLQTRRVSEKGSEQFIKSIAAINGQFPERAGGVCSEVAEIFNAAAYEDSIDRYQKQPHIISTHSPIHPPLPAHATHSMHIMESLLHIVNEVGYPNHVSAEAVPVLKFCIDLVKIDGANGWFYSNDIKVLVDVSLRELSNIAEDDGNVAQDVPLVRVLYIQLIKALLINSPYAGTLGQYRAADVREHFNMIIGKFAFSCTLAPAVTKAPVSASNNISNNQTATSAMNGRRRSRAPLWTSLASFCNRFERGSCLNTTQSVAVVEIYTTVLIFLQENVNIRLF